MAKGPFRPGFFTLFLRWAGKEAGNTISHALYVYITSLGSRHGSSADTLCAASAWVWSDRFHTD